MPKRFSTREFGLLMLPVLAIGAVGWWVSKRPASFAENKMRLSFHLEKPTTLQAFQGYDCAVVIETKDGNGVPGQLTQSTRHLELKTANRTYVSNSPTAFAPFWRKANGSGNINDSRFPSTLSYLPAGKLFFCFTGLATPPPGSNTKPMRLSGKWEINRAALKPLAFATMQRKPLLSLSEIKIIRRLTSSITGRAVFQLEGASMGAETSIETEFTNGQGGMGWMMGGAVPHPKTPRKREVEWTVAQIPKANTQRITGRVSADNRWPLGFQIEPFDFKTAKVGQKLKFKQFPVPLPQP